MLTAKSGLSHWIIYFLAVALVDIQFLRLIEGRLSPRALGMVIEWATIHQAELQENWQRARRQEPLQKIAPLE